jgi:hypothetical protein
MAWVEGPRCSDWEIRLRLLALTSQTAHRKKGAKKLERSSLSTWLASALPCDCLLLIAGRNRSDCDDLTMRTSMPSYQAPVELPETQHVSEHGDKTRFDPIEEPRDRHHGKRQQQAT